MDYYYIAVCIIFFSITRTIIPLEFGGPRNPPVSAEISHPWLRVVSKYGGVIY